MDFLFALCLLVQEKQDEMEKLKERVEQLESELKKKTKYLETEIEKVQEEQLKVPKQEQPQRFNLLNPAITIFLNGAGRTDSGPLTEAGGRIDDAVILRTAEVDFRAAVDPYVDAVCAFDISERDLEAGEFEIEVEEGYGIVKRLPIVESAPLGMRLKAGRYRAPLGYTNLLHAHDLPWSTRPLPARYLTSESLYSESGFTMDGAGAMLRLPSFEGTSVDFETHVAQPGRAAFTEGNDGTSPAFVERLGFFWKPAETHEFSVGLSAYFERGSLSSRLFQADVLYRWRPIGEFRSFVLGGEMFAVKRLFLDEFDLERRNTPLGAYAFAQYQLDWHWYVGVRCDYYQDVSDDAVRTQVYAVYVSYYTSEYFRVRLGGEHRKSDVEEEDGTNSLIVELNFVLGSHPPEPWWVNR